MIEENISIEYKMSSTIGSSGTVELADWFPFSIVCSPLLKFISVNVGNDGPFIDIALKSCCGDVRGRSKENYYYVFQYLITK